MNVRRASIQYYISLYIHYNITFFSVPQTKNHSIGLAILHIAEKKPRHKRIFGILFKRGEYNGYKTVTNQKWAISCNLHTKA